MTRNKELKGQVKRHGFSTRFVHWTVAVSTFLLIFSGFGQLPLYKRYFVDQLAGLGWTSNFSVTLIIHYVAAIALIFAVAYHLTYHIMRKEYDIFPKRGDVKESIQIIKAMLGRGEEPENDKYLAEQRLAYAFIGGALLLIILTGAIKVVKNLSAIEFSSDFLWVTTTLHNVATFLVLFGIIGHLAAFIFKENRALLSSMFNGKVDADYAKERHSKWYKRVDVNKNVDIDM